MPIDNESYELASSPIELDRLVLIVTGAHLRAESGDRPLAYRLRESMLDWRDRNTDDDPPFDVLVVSDVWYLNNEELQSLPVISIGGPGVNALSANLGDQIPSAFVIENDLIVQVDLDFHDFRAVCWGMDHEATIRAVDAFTERYLESYLTEVVQKLDTTG